MVNNSTNIKQNYPAPQLIEHEKRTTTYDVGNPGPGLWRAQRCGEV